MYKAVFKRLVDLVFALLLLLIGSPLILITALSLFLFNNGQVLFTQNRPGINEKIFKLYKFKTMNNKKNEKGELLPDYLRLTRIGKFLRKFSFDELPQLINVLKGDMSLIGPRPWLVEYLSLYNDFQRRRHEVRPGITGWAQVNGRNLLSWKDRFDYDIYYVDNVCFRLDLKIVLKTIWNILTSKGISADGAATMHKFEGNNE